MKISVVIPAYNRADLLERTINSVVNQTYKNLEIIIVDDCSQDTSFERIQELQKKWNSFEIKYIKHEINKGEAGARNTGIRAAKGDYIAFLDSDDEWHEEKLNEQLNFLKNNPFIDGVICENYLVVDPASNHHEITTFPENELKALTLFTKGCGYGIGTNLLLKREKIVYLFDENLRLFIDMDWIYKILSQCRIGILHKPLSFYYKSPMRDGAFIKKHAYIFISKHRDTMKQISLLEEMCFLSTIHWYIAIAYDAHKEFGPAIYHYLVGLLLMPFRRPGNYFNVLKLCFCWIRKKL